MILSHISHWHYSEIMNMRLEELSYWVKTAINLHNELNQDIKTEQR